MRSVTALCFFCFTFAGFAHAQIPLISSAPSGTPLRNNYTGFVGTQFTVGSTAISVQSLGRFIVAGNNGQHNVKIVDAQTGMDVAGASLTLNAAQLAAGSYGYVALSSPAVLTANHSYYLVSQETAGGDQWYDLSSVSANLPLGGSVYTDAAGKYVTGPNTAGTSYVGPNMQYETASQSTPDTISITEPINGLVLTGGSPFNFTATITPSDAPCTQSFYFSIDGQSLGSQFPECQSNPETWAYSLDPGQLLNGSHTITGTYLPPAGSPVVTTPVSFVVTKGAFPLVTNQTLGAIRNNFSGFVGMQFQTPSDLLRVTSLGRYVTEGNAGTHLVKLVDAATGVDVKNASVALSLNGAAPGTYVYAVLSSPVSLLVNHAYYLLSQETAGGDQWDDIGPVITSNIAIAGPVYQTASGYVFVPDAGYSYVPINLGYQDLGINPGPTVTITAPTNNQSLPPSVISVQATVVPDAQASVASVQLVVDGKPSGVAYGGSTPPAYGLYNNIATLPLDVNSLSNETHSIAVQATDSLGAVGISPTVMVQVSGASAPVPFVTGFTPTFLRNNYTGLVGTEFTVGPSVLNVTALGRYCVAGNSGTHTIYVYSTTGGYGYYLPFAQASISMSNCAPGQYVYASVSPVMLSPAASYYLADSEASGGDLWYDYAQVTTTNAAAVLGSAYSPFSEPATFNNVPATSTSYVPLNFLYDVASSTSSTLAVSIGADTTSTSVTVNASSNVPITSVQVQVDGYSIKAPLTTAPYTQALPNLNFGTHTLTAIAKDSSGNTQTSAPFVITPAPPGEAPPNYEFFFPVMTITPGAPRNNYTGWVGFQFTTGTTYTIPSTPPFAINVNQPVLLSRTCSATDVLPHFVKIVVASTGQDLPNAGGWVNCGALSGTGNRLGETLIGAPLLPGTTYYLVSQEMAGGDTFTDAGPAMPLIGGLAGGMDVPYWSNFTIDGPVYFDGAKYVLVPLPNYSYASLLLYGMSDPI